MNSKLPCEEKERAPVWGWTMKEMIGSIECRPQCGQRASGVGELEGVSGKIGIVGLTVACWKLTL